MNRSSATTATRDEGSVLAISLVMVIVTSLVVSSLLDLTSSVTRARPILRARTASVESASSAMRAAVLGQVAAGTGACVDGAAFSAAAFDLNGFDVTTRCDVIDSVDSTRRRYGIVTTSMRPTVTALAGSTTAGAAVKDVYGDVFISGGELVSRTGDILVRDVPDAALVEYSWSVAPAPGVADPMVPPAARYSFGGGAPIDCSQAVVSADGYPQSASTIDGAVAAHTHSCAPEPGVPWWERAGAAYAGAASPDDRTYPPLPAPPSIVRDGVSIDFSTTCRVFYPGRYTTALNLTGTGKQYYFASGVYHFTAPITVSGGASVVFGEGRKSGCAVDADLALAPDPGFVHGITGRGATLVLDGAAKIVVRRASFAVNTRISSSSTRGSEGIAIRTVSAGISNADLQVPRDIVQVGEYPCRSAGAGCVEPPAPDPANLANTVDLAAATSPTGGYTGSTLGHDDAAILVDYSASTNLSTSSFDVDGAIFTPNAGFLLVGPTAVASASRYRFRATGGIVASTVTFDARALPTNPSTNWFAGIGGQPTQLRVALTTEAINRDGVGARSTAIVVVRANGAFAVESWAVNPMVGG